VWSLLEMQQYIDILIRCINLVSTKFSNFSFPLNLVHAKPAQYMVS